MPVTPQERFKAAVSRGMAASPFTAALIFITGSTRKQITGCIVNAGDNKAKADEMGLDHVRTLDAHIPKSLVPTKPVVNRDAVEYDGRPYSLQSVSGDGAHSPVWVIYATAPL